MNKDVFSREEEVLRKAQEALSLGSCVGLGTEAYAELAQEYARLFRQTQRVVAMGDRFQRSLSTMNLRLAASEERYRSIFENMAEGVFRTKGCSLDGSILADRLVEANQALASMLGSQGSIALVAGGRLVSELFVNDAEREGFAEALRRDGAVHGFQAELYRLDNTRFWAQVSARVLRESASAEAVQAMPGVKQYLVGVVVDVSERRRMLDEICRLARTDSLTGLWNRGYFMDLARHELLRTRRESSPLSVIMIDVDHFKCVNDTHGHEAGDNALRCLAEVLSLSVREEDLVARLGGEEFVVLLPNSRLSDACSVAERIREGVRARQLDCRSGACFGLTVSAGVATRRGQDPTSLEELLRCADEALYTAKRTGRDRVEIFGGAA